MHSLTHGESLDPPTFFRLPRWRWGKVAAARAEADEARSQVSKLEQELIARDVARREMMSAHAAEVLLLTARAEAQLEDARSRSDAALTDLTIELEAHACEQLNTEVRAVRDESARAAAEAAEQHAVALAALHTQLHEAEARAATLAQDLPLQIDAARREAASMHQAEVWALTTQSATQLDAARRDAADALAAQATRLRAQAEGEVAAAVRTFQKEAEASLANTVKQHNVAIAAIRAELDDTEKRRARLEHDLPAEVEHARREEKAAHALQMVALEEQAEARLATTLRDTETALALLAQELETQASARLDSALRAARDEANRVAAATAQQHAGELASLRAQLQDVEARRAALEHDLPIQVEAARREVSASHITELSTLRAQAAAQVESAVREARDEAALAATKTGRKHIAALARLRGERDEALARVMRLEQDLDIELVRRREAGNAHAAELAGVQTQADARVEAAVRDARAEADRAASEIAQQHLTALAMIKVDLEASEARRAQAEREIPVQVEAARREAAVAHAKEIAALRTQATAQMETAIRETRDEAARAALDATARHAEALAAMRYELEDAEARRMRTEQDLALHVVLRREAVTAHAAELTGLRVQAAAQLEAAVKQTREDAARAAAHVAEQHALAIEAVQTELTESEARLAKLEDELPARIDAMRRDAGATHAMAVAALKQQAAAQIEAAVLEARSEAARAAQTEARLEDLRRQLQARQDDDAARVVEHVPSLPGMEVAAVVRPHSTARQIAVVTGALVVSGVTGSLVAWSVVLWGILQ